MKYAIQLWSIKDEISDKASVSVALKKLKEFGYDGVELAGYYGMTADEMKEELEKAGLVAISAHEGLDRFENDADEFLPYLKELGIKMVGMSFSHANSPEEIERTKKALIEGGKKAAEYGMEIMYHNHRHEFEDVEGVIPMDEIKKVSKLEVDTLWVLCGGHDPIKYLEDNKDVLQAIHIKDGIVSENKPCTIGTGENDIKGLIEKSAELGFDWVILENDKPTPRGFDDAENGMKWIKANIDV